MQNHELYRDFSQDAMGNATEVEFQLTANGSVRTLIVRVKKLTLLRVAGTAANWQPRLLSATGGSDTRDEAWKDAVPSAVATLFNEDFPADGIYMRTDTNGKIYLRPGWDAGADNEVSGRIFLEVVQSIGV